jgi:hypothetical protein
MFNFRGGIARVGYFGTLGRDMGRDTNLRGNRWVGTQQFDVWHPIRSCSVKLAHDGGTALPIAT